MTKGALFLCAFSCGRTFIVESNWSGTACKCALEAHRATHGDRAAFLDLGGTRLTLTPSGVVHGWSDFLGRLDAAVMAEWILARGRDDMLWGIAAFLGRCHRLLGSSTASRALIDCGISVIISFLAPWFEDYAVSVWGQHNNILGAPRLLRTARGGIAQQWQRIDPRTAWQTLERSRTLCSRLSASALIAARSDLDELLGCNRKSRAKARHSHWEANAIAKPR